MDFKRMFMGDRNTMTTFRQKGKIGLIGLWAVVILTVGGAILNGAITLIGEIIAPTAEAGIGIAIITFVGVIPMSLFVSLPNIAIALGYQIRQKIVSTIGAIISLISAVVNIITAIVAFVALVAMLFVEFSGSAIFSSLSNAVELFAVLIVALAAAAMLWIILSMEGKGKLGITALTVTQVVLAVLYLIGWLIALIGHVISFSTVLVNDGFLATVPVLSAVLVSAGNHIALIGGCIATILFAIGILRTKKAIATEVVAEVEGVEVAENAEVTADEALEATEAAAEESAPVAEGEIKEVVEEGVETPATEA